VTTGKNTTQALRVVAETASRPDLVVVLGMHRAGTSALARGLKVLGVELGDRMMAPSATENPTGYWEDLDIYELNMSMMKALGRDWHSLHATTSTDIDYLRRNGYMLRASELLRSKTQDVRTFGFKDPRLAVLLPFWKEVFAARRYEVAYLIALRNPLSVTRSLATRNALASEKSYYLWLEHMLPSLEMQPGARHIVMDYDCLMATPREQLQRTADAFGMELDEAEVAKYESEFLDSSLRHTEYTEADLELDPACPPLVVDVYRELHALARLPGSLGAEQLAVKLTSWQRDLATLQPALNFADGVLAKLESATRDLNVRTSEAAELQLGLHARSAELEAARSALSTLSERSSELEIALEARSESIRSLRIEGQSLQQLQEKLDAHHKEMAQREAAIDQLQREMHAIRATATDRESSIRELQQELESSRQAAAESTSAFQQAQESLSASRDGLAQRDAAALELRRRLLAEEEAAAQREAIIGEFQLEIGVLRDAATARESLIGQLQGELESSRHALAESASDFQRLVIGQEAAFVRASNAEIEQERLRAALAQSRSDAAVQAAFLEQREDALAKLRGEVEASLEAATRRESLVERLQHNLETSQHAVARASAERDALVRRVEADQQAASQRAAEHAVEHRRLADALVKAQRDAASQAAEMERALLETRQREELLQGELRDQASELTQERGQVALLVDSLAQRDASIEALRTTLDAFDASLEVLTSQSIELDRQITLSAERHVSDMAAADESVRAMTARHDAARHELAAANTSLETHSNALAALNLDVHALRQRSQALEQENARLLDSIRLGNGEASELRGRIDELKTTALERMNLVGRQLTDERLAKEEFLRLLIDANTRIDQLRRSWSWRMTAPLRALGRRRSK
jgi:hypothetical protein